MRTLVLAATASAFLLAACAREPSDDGSAATDAAPVEAPAPQPVLPADPTPLPAPPVAGEKPAQEPAPPSPVVDGMYVVYRCNDGSEPRITFSGNLVKVELTVTSKPAVLAARASATGMSDTYSDDALTLHRDGLGITLDFGGGTTTRCTESQASA